MSRVTTNKDLYKPFKVGQISPRAWMALNDVNILSEYQSQYYGLVYEFAYVKDGTKRWAKSTFDETDGDSYADLIEIVEQTRNEIDEA